MTKILDGLSLVVGAVAVIAMLAAAMTYRFGFLPISSSIFIVKIAVFAAIGALTVGILTLAVHYFSSTPGLLLPFVGLALGALVAAPLIPLAVAAKKVPRIHDITTDFENPPQFVAILPLRASAPNSAVYAGKEIADQQRAAYPDIQSRVLAVAPKDAFAKALAAVQAMHLEVAAADENSGRIEATATSFWFGFKDDLVIRISADAKGSRVDARSVSRVGVSDIGKNAERIRGFMAHIE